MDRLAAGIIIAIAALLMSGGLVRDAQAGEAGAVRATATETAPVTSLPPAAIGLRSEPVLSLLLTLEALRSAPGLLDTSKV